jgi:hypothetical protein
VLKKGQTNSSIPTQTARDIQALPRLNCADAEIKGKMRRWQDLSMKMGIFVHKK